MTRTERRQQHKRQTRCFNRWFLAGILKGITILSVGVLIAAVWLWLWVGASDQHYQRVMTIRHDRQQEITSPTHYRTHSYHVHEE